MFTVLISNNNQPLIINLTKNYIDMMGKDEDLEEIAALLICYEKYHISC